MVGNSVVPFADRRRPITSVCAVMEGANRSRTIYSQNDPIFQRQSLDEAGGVGAFAQLPGHWDSGEAERRFRRKPNGIPGYWVRYLPWEIEGSARQHQTPEANLSIAASRC